MGIWRRLDWPPRILSKAFGHQMEDKTPVDERDGVCDTAEDIAPAAGDIAALCADRDQLIAAKTELQERWLRLRAEFENYRRRTQKEQMETFERASMDVIAALLPVMDDFERALQVETADAEYAKGIGLIHQRLLDTLKKAGLEPCEAKGKPFDPNLHEAIDMAPTDQAEENTVFDELRKGYNFRGKPLRPAMVRVAVKPQRQK